jgi:hypothetical protein
VRESPRREALWSERSSGDASGGHGLPAHLAGVGGEMQAEEITRLGECSAGLIEHRGKGLENVRNPGCDLQRHGNVGGRRSGSEPRGVVEEDLV